jgi:hypothetical protein
VLIHADQDPAFAARINVPQSESKFAPRWTLRVTGVFRYGDRLLGLVQRRTGYGT